MVLPLLALGLPLAFAGYAGRTALDDMFADNRREAAGADFADAIENARVGAGVEEARPTPDFVGPMPEAQTVDLAQLGINLAGAGYPGGLDLLGSTVAGQTDFERDIRMQQDADLEAFRRLEYAQEQANMRHQAGLDADAAAAGPPQRYINDPVLGPVPVNPEAVGSTAWRGMRNRGVVLQGMGRRINQLRQFIADHGSELPGGPEVQRIGAIVNQLMLDVNQARELGALDQGSQDLLMDIIPDPRRLTPEFFSGQSGKAEALAEWYNNIADAYLAETEFQTGMPQLGRLSTRLDVPAGLRLETPEETLRAVEGERETPVERRRRFRREGRGGSDQSTFSGGLSDQQRNLGME